MKALLGLLLALALVGCERNGSPAPQQKLYGATHIEIWHDDQRNVTCWLYGGTNGGISCLPDGMLSK